MTAAYSLSSSVDPIASAPYAAVAIDKGVSSQSLILALSSGVNYEDQVLKYLESLITSLGGVVPVMPSPSNYRARHLQLLASLASALA